MYSFVDEGHIPEPVLYATNITGVRDDDSALDHNGELLYFSRTSSRNRGTTAIALAQSALIYRPGTTLPSLSSLSGIRNMARRIVRDIYPDSRTRDLTGTLCRMIIKKAHQLPRIFENPGYISHSDNDSSPEGSLVNNTPSSPTQERSFTFSYTNNESSVSTMPASSLSY
ncbi:MAG: hypothetical protein ACRCV3_03210 [Desulfovibrionaceae bacterium]